ncbi:MAG: phospholipase [Planctomycetes bacterium]|nr:phospholipase [Planctomycetota bacterium]
MIETFRELTDQDLRLLAAALRLGRLEPPYTAAALQRYLPPQLTEVLAPELQRLSAEGLRPDHLAWFLEALAAERGGRTGVLEAVDLVSTGPEAPGAANRDTAIVVRELFAAARRHVLVAGYAVHQGRQVFQALAERMDLDPALRVRMFLDVRRPQGDTSADSEVLARFATRFRRDEWPGRRLPEVYHDPRSLALDPARRASLHAKCVVVDREVAFISSANFTEAAQERNIEVGVLIRSASLAAKIAHHFESLAEAGYLVPVSGIVTG